MIEPALLFEAVSSFESATQRQTIDYMDRLLNAAGDKRAEEADREEHS